MNIETPSSIIAQAEDYWESEGIPLLREPRPGDQILILGFSLGQEKPVLLSREPNADEDYGVAAAEAFDVLHNHIPDCFTCDGETVANVSTGFTDGCCEYYSEITFDEYWHVSLFQGWLDENNIAICIRPSAAMEDDKVISDHVALARFDIDRSIRYAAFKAMGVRYEIRKFVNECWTKRRQLPTGTHLLSGVTVTFREIRSPSD
jgi:hypothetical protein